MFPGAFFQIVEGRMFLKRTLKILSNLILLVVLCTGQVAAAPNARPAEDGSQQARLEPSPGPGSTMRVSVSSEGVEGDDDSTHFPSISADGRYVAFTSEANNLVDGDTNGVGDVFVHDYLTNATTRVSVNSSGEEGNFESLYYTSLSADGRYVAFQSYANNLVDGDLNYRRDVFVRDTLANTTIRVSVNSSGGEGNDHSDTPSISANGRYVAFESAASNLVSGDTNGYADIFVRDTLTNTTKLVSVNSSGVKGSGGEFPSISADGRYVAFLSFATDLVDGDTNGVEDVFVRDTLTNTTTCVSVNSSGVIGNDRSYGHSSISADGRYVAFSSAADNLVDGDTKNSGDVFLRDTLMNTTTIVSVSSNGVKGNVGSSSPSISADGRYVAFASVATNLVDDDTNGIIQDIFVRDTLTNTTIRVSVNSSGGEGNDRSDTPCGI
jgi:Tol biopolymer transport system component